MMDERAAFLGFIREALDLPPTEPVETAPLLKGGSDRRFYRILCGQGKTYIFMHYDPARTENNYYAAIAGLLCEIGVRVPAILGCDPRRSFILMEDLGERDLWSFRDAAPEEKGALYRAAISEILKLHGLDLEVFEAKNVPVMPGFDPALYEWEHEYFRDKFLGGVCGMDVQGGERRALKKELAGLIAEMEGQGTCLIHRDFQSQNIMVRNDTVSIIDFQGMRRGSPFYDLGSLLYDPYVNLDETFRIELLNFYHERAGTAESLEAFASAFRKASVQRLMQALGAYGFLAKEKGKTAFLKYIPQAVANLLDAARRAQCMPVLTGIAERCREIVSRLSAEEPR